LSVFTRSIQSGVLQDRVIVVSCSQVYQSVLMTQLSYSILVRVSQVYTNVYHEDARFFETVSNVCCISPCGQGMLFIVGNHIFINSK
jgi:hypothetical protein